MRAVLLVAFGSVLCAAAAWAQGAADAPPPDKTFASAADVAAMIAAKKNNTLVALAPYRAGLEYRTGPQTALVHQKEAELIYVIDGSGTMILGGTLDNPKPNRADNLSGSGISGGAHLKLEAGAMILVPENTPHQFTDIQGTLVDMALHVPGDGAAAPGAAGVRTFSSADDVKAMIAARKNATPLSLDPYRAGLQYRTGPQPALLHEKAAELSYIVEGSGTLTMGGTLDNAKSVRPGLQSGTGITGGTALKIEKGSVIFIPENTPHQYSGFDGVLVNLEFQVPRPLPAPASGAKPAQ